MDYYFDTSAIIKIYHREKGSDIAILLFENESSENYLSQLVITEFTCAMYRKLRRHEIAEEKDVLQSIGKFSVDIAYENILEIDTLIFTEAKNLIIKWGNQFSLKTLDALHLASLVQLSQFTETTFISADKKLCDVVTAMGYDIINPENPGNLKIIEPA